MIQIKQEYKTKLKKIKSEYKAKLKNLKSEYKKQTHGYKQTDEYKQTVAKTNGPKRSLLEEIGNAVTHGVGAIFAIFAGIPFSG